MTGRGYICKGCGLKVFHFWCWNTTIRRHQRKFRFRHISTKSPDFAQDWHESEISRWTYARKLVNEKSHNVSSCWVRSLGSHNTVWINSIEIVLLRLHSVVQYILVSPPFQAKNGFRFTIKKQIEFDLEKLRATLWFPLVENKIYGHWIPYILDCAANRLSVPESRGFACSVPRKIVCFAMTTTFCH